MKPQQLLMLYHFCLFLQASTYESEELAEAHPIMQELWNTMGSEEEYDAVASTLAHMLHPNTSVRATVTAVLQSAMFADC